MYAMLMGSMFLLPVFMQEVLGFDATQSGITLMPRTVAMMLITPFIGRLYNHIPPALTVGFGAVLFVLGSYELSHITLQSGSTDIIIPLIITGFGFACLFIPLTTAALTFVSLHERGLPFPLALAATLGIMLVLAVAIERFVLRPLVTSPPLALFLATLGLACVLEGLAQLVWGTQVHGLDLGISDSPIDGLGVQVSRFDLFAAGLGIERAHIFEGSQFREALS